MHTVENPNGHLSFSHFRKNCEEEVLSTLFRQCGNILIKVELTNINIPIDNENDNTMGQRLSTFVRECERLGKLLLAISHERKRNILYLGVTAGFFHLNGIKKLLGYNYLTIQKDLKELQDYGIIRLLDDEEKSNLKKFHIALGMREYDFERADFYIINPAYRKFLDGLPWEEIIKGWIKNRIERWAKKLRQTKHKTVKAQIEIEKRKEIEERTNDFISKLHSKFVEYIGNNYRSYQEAWFYIRKKLRAIYIKKLEGKDWRALAENDFLISCIEHEDLDTNLLDEVLEQIEKRRRREHVRYR